MNEDRFLSVLITLPKKTPQCLWTFVCWHLSDCSHKFHSKHAYSGFPQPRKETNLFHIICVDVCKRCVQWNFFSWKKNVVNEFCIQYNRKGMHQPSLSHHITRKKNSMVFASFLYFSYSYKLDSTKNMKKSFKKHVQTSVGMSFTPLHIHGHNFVSPQSSNSLTNAFIIFSYNNNNNIRTEFT